MARTGALYCIVLASVVELAGCRRRNAEAAANSGPPGAPVVAPTPALPPGTTAVRWADDAMGFAGREFGVPHRVFCPPGGTAAPVFGAELYSVRSSICTAAVHMRRITLARGGLVTFYTWPQASRLRASLRQGIQSLEAARDFTFTFTPYIPRHHELVVSVMGPVPVNARQPRTEQNPLPEAPPPPPPAPVEPAATFSARDNAQRWRGQSGTAHAIVCPPIERTATIWGNEVYTDDSPVCVAALHDGRISNAGGPVTVYIEPGLPRYPSATRNGVRSSTFGRWPGSYTFRWIAPRVPPVIPATPVAITWQTTASQLRGMTGTTAAFVCPPGDLPEPVFGGGTGTPYSDDSSICTAAVHAGVFGWGGGTVRVTIGPQTGIFDAGDQNEVATGLTFGGGRSGFTVSL